ncbi:MAG: hypothetical protein ABW128_03215, partial [Rhizorhabdus sp.]
PARAGDRMQHRHRFRAVPHAGLAAPALLFAQRETEVSPLRMSANIGLIDAGACSVAESLEMMASLLYPP